MILYALIARRTDVLAEYLQPQVNFQVSTVTRLVLQRITDEDKRKSFKYEDSHFFHCVVDDGICYMCLSDADYSPRVVFGFLDSVKAEFVGSFGSAIFTAHAFAYNSEFAPVLQDRINLFNTDPKAASSDKLGGVQQKIDATTKVMIENIDKIFERGEKIDLLVDKTEQLDQSAFKFERSAKELKRAMCCKRLKTYLVVFVVLCLVVFFIAAMVCGGLSFKNCRN